MLRTITVKGVGRVTTAPDYVIVSMNLVTQEYDYEEALELAAKKIEQINASLEGIGFEKKSVKTTDFRVRTEYEHEKDASGSYRRVFSGFACSHRLKVEFDFDARRLAQTLCTVSKSLAQPELSISFTVKDPSAVNEELLRSATANARAKAAVLCEASGVELGRLLTINYNWGEINVFSRTDYELEDGCVAMPGAALEDVDIEPDDIEVSDTATFVWEIR